MSLNLVYAYNKDNDIVSVDDVPNGLACGCVCPSCHEPLVAKNNGKIVSHHFAHVSGESCVTGYQTSLHLLAKKIIQKNKKIFLPVVEVNYFYSVNRPDERGNYKHGVVFHKMLHPASFFEGEIERIELEKHEGDVIPDIVVYFSNGFQLYVEIYVSHKVDEDKRQRIIKRGVSCIEVDLSKEERLLSEEELTSLLYDFDFMKNHCRWVYNRKKLLKEQHYRDFVARHGQYIWFKIRDSKQGTGLTWYTTYYCPWGKKQFDDGYRVLSGAKFRNFEGFACMNCYCNHGIRPHGFECHWNGSPEIFEIFCIFNAIDAISETFNLGLFLDDPDYDDDDYDPNDYRFLRGCHPATDPEEDEGFSLSSELDDVSIYSP